MELSKCKTLSTANQIVRNKHNDEELELLHLKPFGKTFNPAFMKIPFLQTVKITTVSSQVMISLLLFSLYFIEKSL